MCRTLCLPAGSELTFVRRLGPHVGAGSRRRSKQYEQGGLISPACALRRPGRANTCRNTIDGRAPGSRDPRVRAFRLPPRRFCKRFKIVLGQVVAPWVADQNERAASSQCREPLENAPPDIFALVTKRPPASTTSQPASWPTKSWLMHSTGDAVRFRVERHRCHRIIVDLNAGGVLPRLPFHRGNGNNSPSQRRSRETVLPPHEGRHCRECSAPSACPPAQAKAQNGGGTPLRGELLLGRLPNGHDLGREMQPELQRKRWFESAPCWHG